MLPQETWTRESGNKRRQKEEERKGTHLSRDIFIRLISQIYRWLVNLDLESQSQSRRKGEEAKAKKEEQAEESRLEKEEGGNQEKRRQEVENRGAESRRVRGQRAQ